MNVIKPCPENVDVSSVDNRLTDRLDKKGTTFLIRSD